MGIMGEPEAAVSGNASEVPDSESGEQGNHALPENANSTAPEEEPGPWERGDQTP